MNDFDLRLEVASRSRQPLSHCTTFGVQYLRNR